MAYRLAQMQSQHDAVVHAAQDIYRDKGKICWINPNGEKNKVRGAYWIDIIVANTESDSTAWLIEIETEDSVSQSEAQDQWSRYSTEYGHWHLAVPSGSEDKAKQLLVDNSVLNCTIITWQRNGDGAHTF